MLAVIIDSILILLRRLHFLFISYNLKTNFELYGKFLISAGHFPAYGLHSRRLVGDFSARGSAYAIQILSLEHKGADD